MIIVEVDIVYLVTIPIAIAILFFCIGYLVCAFSIDISHCGKCGKILTGENIATGLPAISRDILCRDCYDKIINESAHDKQGYYTKNIIIK